MEKKQFYLRPESEEIILQKSEFICDSPKVGIGGITKQEFEDGGEHKADDVEW